MKNDLISHTLSALNSEFDYYTLMGITKADKDGNSEICKSEKGDADVVRGLQEAALHKTEE